MRNNAVKIAALAAACVISLSGCVMVKAEPLDLSRYKLVEVETEHEVYTNDLNALIAASDLIVTGKFTDNANQNGEYNSSVGDFFSSNTLAVSAVHKGECGDTITVSQRYGVDEQNKQIICCGGLAPMYMDTEWIMFLKYDEAYDSYWTVGDTCGRHPVPKGAALEIAQTAQQIVTEKYELLKGRTSPEPDEQFTYMVGDTSGNLFYVTQDTINEVIKFESRLAELKETINPVDFGVITAEDINLEFYISVLNNFATGW